MTLKIVIDNIKMYKHKSIFCKILLGVLIMTFVPFAIVSVVLIASYNDKLDREIYQSMKTSVEQLSRKIDTIYQDKNRCMYIATTDSDIGIWLDYKDNVIEYEEQYIIDSINCLHNMKLHIGSLESAYVYRPRTGQVITSDGIQFNVRNSTPYDDTEWIEYCDNQQLVVRKYNGKTYITVFERLSYGLQDGGWIILNFTDDSIRDLGNNEHNYIILDHNSPIYSLSSISEEQERLIDNIEQKNASNVSQYSDMYYIINPTEFDGIDALYIESKGERVVKIYFIVLLLVGLLLFALLTTIVATVYFYKLILQLVNIIDENSFDSGNLSKDNSVPSIYDKVLLDINVNNNIDKDLENQLIEYKNMRLTMLQLQFNPHFLFNSLQLINSKIVELEGCEEAEYIVSIISDLFREALNSENYTIPLEHEIELANKYILIQKIKYKDKFSVLWDIDYELYNCEVIKFCLQPIIENALFHGILPTKENCSISIYGKRQGEKLVLEIHNTGKQIEEDRIKEIREGLHKSIVRRNGSIGLSNLNQRIKILFGDEFGLSIDSDELGTTIKLTFPYKEIKWEDA